MTVAIGGEHHVQPYIVSVFLDLDASFSLVVFQMEQSAMKDVEEDLDRIDLDSIKLEAIIQLKVWQKKMLAVIDRTYKSRLHEIDSIASNRANEIREKHEQWQHVDTNDANVMRQFKRDVDVLKSDIAFYEMIPENLQRRIERTIVIRSDGEQDDAELVDEDDDDDDDQYDDETVVIGMDKSEARHRNRVTVVVAAAPPSNATNTESRVSRVLNSQPVQRALAASLVRTLTQMTTVAAASTTTVAATTMAKTALIATACGIGTVAYGVGRVALGTTQRIWSFVVSSDE